MKRTRHGIVLGGMPGSVVASLWLAGSSAIATGAEQPDIPDIPARTEFVQAVRAHGTMLGTLVAHIHVCDPVHPVGGLTRSDWQTFLERLGAGDTDTREGLEAFDDAVKAEAVAPCRDPKTAILKTRMLTRSGLETLKRLKRLAWIPVALRNLRNGRSA